MADRARFEIACGFVGPSVSLGAILLATILAPAETFTWHGRALSDLGRPGTGTFWLFNGALVVGSLVGFPFARRLWLESVNGLQRFGVLALAITLVGLGGVGVFFIEHTEYYLSASLHAPAALVFFAGAPITNWIYGAGALRAGDRSWGLVTIAFGVGHVLTWVVWIRYQETIASEPGAWFAVQEAVASALFGAWIFLFAARLWRADRR